MYLYPHTKGNMMSSANTPMIISQTTPIRAYKVFEKQGNMLWEGFKQIPGYEWVQNEEYHAYRHKKDAVHLCKFLSMRENFVVRPVLLAGTVTENSEFGIKKYLATNMKVLTGKEFTNKEKATLLKECAKNKEWGLSITCPLCKFFLYGYGKGCRHCHHEILSLLGVSPNDYANCSGYCPENYKGMIQNTMTYWNKRNGIDPNVRAAFRSATNKHILKVAKKLKA